MFEPSGHRPWVGSGDFGRVANAIRPMASAEQGCRSREVVFTSRFRTSAFATWDSPERIVVNAYCGIATGASALTLFRAHLAR